MKEHESNLTPEAIDALTERQSSELSREEKRLIRDVYSYSEAYARENEHSLEQIWSRLVQSQEHANSFQGRQQQEPGKEQLFMEGKAMQHEDIYQELLREKQQQNSSQEKEFATLNSQPTARRRRSLWRTVSISVAAAVVLLAVLSWALLSAGLRHNTTVGGNRTAQTSLSAEKLLCSFSDNNNKVYIAQPSLDWSANGQIATTYNNLKTFSAQGCAAGSTIPGQFSSALWSPDGKHLLVFYQQTFAKVLDASTGRVVASFPPAYPNPNTGTGISFMSNFSGGPSGASPTEIVDQSVWSADGTRVISVTTKQVSQTTNTTRVVVWNASTGAVVRVAMTLPSNVRPLGDSQQNGGISPDGKYIAVQNANNSIGIWSIDSGKLVSTIPFSKLDAKPDQSSPSALAWSPDDASLALGLPNASKVQIWSTASGQLAASFTDHDAAVQIIGALAWSPNGKYLAESGSDIHIWDVATQKTVITFGKVEKGNWIATLAWSPDSSMLASSSNEESPTGQGVDHTLNPVSVWQLS
jgi:WD40 repeat protein